MNRHINQIVICVLINGLAAAIAQTQTPPNLGAPVQTAIKTGVLNLAVPDIAFDEVQCNIKEMVIPPVGKETQTTRTQKFTVPVIAPGASFTTQNTSSVPLFFYRTELKCVADSAGVSGETNKANNSFNYEYDPSASNITATSRIPANLPLLKKSDLALLAANYQSMQRVGNGKYRFSFSVTVKNVGELAVNGAKVKCVVKYEYDKGDQTLEVAMPTLAVNATETVQFTADATPVNIGLKANAACELKTARPQDDTNAANNSTTLNMVLPN
jgi:hypothetical protein